MSGEFSKNMAEGVQIMRRWRSENRRVVFTNGCFDLLHPGHIDYLQRARALGDALVIGLNDDASVGGLKGETRPINPMPDRACILAALRCVDMVVPFSESTPLNLIKALKPDVLVKGGDYQEENIVGAREVRDNGGEVVIMPFIKGFSSSALIQRIVDKC
ncbi:MAG: D-glycero-beta-D-manno-heptose 1-phosphate adenylyltransferase [Mariprofundaceae bacterium]